MWQIHLEAAGSLQNGEDKHHPSLGRVEAGTNYTNEPGAAVVLLLPRALMIPNSLGARAGSALALLVVQLFSTFSSTCAHAFQAWKLCPCAHLCSVALEPLEL